MSIAFSLHVSGFGRGESRKRLSGSQEAKGSQAGMLCATCCVQALWQSTQIQRRELWQASVTL